MPFERAPPDVSIWSFLVQPQSCRRHRRITAWRRIQTFWIARSQPVEGRRPALQVGVKCVNLMTQLPKLNQEKDPRDSVWGGCPAAARVQFAEVPAQNASHQQDLDAVVGPCWRVSQESFCSSVSTCRQFSQQSDFGRGGPEGIRSNKLQMNFCRRPQEVVL